MSLIGFGKDVEKNLIASTSPFVCSMVKERTVLRILKLIDCDNGEIGTYAKLVNDRNQTAHPNGHIFFSTKAGTVKLTDLLEVPLIDMPAKSLIFHDG